MLPPLLQAWQRTTTTATSPSSSAAAVAAGCRRVRAIVVRVSDDPTIDRGPDTHGMKARYFNRASFIVAACTTCVYARDVLLCLHPLSVL